MSIKKERRCKTLPLKFVKLYMYFLISSFHGLRKYKNWHKKFINIQTNGRLEDEPGYLHNIVWCTDCFLIFIWTKFLIKVSYIVEFRTQTWHYYIRQKIEFLFFFSVFICENFQKNIRFKRWRSIEHEADRASLYKITKGHDSIKTEKQKSQKSFLCT